MHVYSLHTFLGIPHPEEEEERESLGGEGAIVSKKGLLSRRG